MVMVRVPLKKGGFRLQPAVRLKSGKLKFVKSLRGHGGRRRGRGTRRKTSGRRFASRSTKPRRSHMARRRGRRGRRSRKIPLLTVGTVAVQAAVANAGGGDMGQKLSRFISYYTGFDAAASFSFNPAALLFGWGPHAAIWGVGKIGIGRSVSQKLGRFLPVSLS